MNDMTLAEAQGMSQAPSVNNAMSSTRESQEVQAAVFMAKRFPRNENESLARIMRSCQRVALAEKAIYTYPKSDQNVSGPSIRLAEAIAQAWGNIQTGVVELEQRPGESTCMAYCWDIETNTRECKIFTVPHQISTKKGIKVLTDPRDIYELVANQGARRKRACILNVIPGDIVDAAVMECGKTLARRNKTPLIDRLRNMVNILQSSFSVPLRSIEKYFGYPLEAFTEMDGATLAGIYNALKDGSAKREDYFDLPKVKDEAIDSTGATECPGPSVTDSPKTGNTVSGQSRKVSLNDV